MLTPDLWVALLASIRSECLAFGSWCGEARLLRDAAGAKRIGHRVAEVITARLAVAGYEIDEEILCESQSVIVTPTGTRDLAATVEALLPHIRRWDAAIPSLPWRDALIAGWAVGRFLEERRGPSCRT
jgi:hypothetical protein